ncbi:MAG: glycosyltransferase family 39 protein [Planctomycetes bacterium]|nr:glycosyltransferase family 39 protein [Planctomycetota bacterium]
MPRSLAVAARTRVGQLFFLLSLTGFLFFFRLADRDLWSSHEGRAAQDAQTILREGCWGLPRLFDQHLELQKPPLYYWLVAGLGKVRGGPVDAWAVRLPAALSGLLTVLGLYGLGWYRGRPVAGLLGAVILATAQHYTWLAHIGRIDMPLCLAVSVALGGFYLGQRCRQERAGRGAWGWFLLAYVASAIAVLLKGPIGIILPAAGAGLSLLVEGELPVPWAGRRWWRLAHELGLWWGLFLVLGLAAPWFVWAEFQTGGALGRTFFWYHNLDRALGAGGLRDYPWWFYGPRLAMDFLPWTVVVPAAGWFLYRRGLWRQDPEVRFGLTWLAALVLLLSCVGFKRGDYLVPAYPGAALFLGGAGERWLQSVRYPRRWAALGLALVLACVAGWWIFLTQVLPRSEAQREDQRFAAAIRRLTPGRVLFFRVEAHALAFHLGPPVETLMEWENLDIWASRPDPIYILMRPDNAAEWPRYITSGRLEEVLRNTDLSGGEHEHPLILMRTSGRRTGADACPTEWRVHPDERLPRTAPDRDCSAECGAAGPLRGEGGGDCPGLVRPTGRARTRG